MFVELSVIHYDVFVTVNLCWKK